jgi:hypothetical protein
MREAALQGTLTSSVFGEENMTVAAPFKPGNFVRLKRGPTGSVGVVWQIRPKNRASVEVYWGESDCEKSCFPHEPKGLDLVVDGVPEYAIKLKNMLFPS